MLEAHVKAGNLEKAAIEVEKIKLANKHVQNNFSNMKAYLNDEYSNKSALDFKKIMTEVKSLLDSKLKASETKLIFECEMRSSMIFANMIELSQVILNLIKNAIEAVHDLEDKWIMVSLQEDENYHIIYVVDSGRGIPIDIRDKVFERLFTTKADGTGVGLNLCKKILERHYGSIKITDDYPGTCFKLTLPKEDK